MALHALRSKSASAWQVVARGMQTLTAAPSMLVAAAGALKGAEAQAPATDSGKQKLPVPSRCVTQRALAPQEASAVQTSHSAVTGAGGATHV
jgi:hypothetical protein